MDNKKPSLLDSKLYITEAAKSKEQSSKELTLPDPDKEDVKNILAKNEINVANTPKS